MNMRWSSGVQFMPGRLIGQYGGSRVRKQTNRHEDQDDGDDDQDDRDEI